MSKQSTESLSLEAAQRLLPQSIVWVNAILDRLAPDITVDRPLQTLDIGAAQGRAVIAMTRRGHRGYGVEPWDEARKVSQELAAAEGTSTDIRKGTAEDIPFPDNSFDIVTATSVIEHVTDLDAALREVWRVLVPGGLFWFNAASSMCPRQDEISKFPAFGWYPLPIKRKVMWWAVENSPDLVGHTKTPAIHWFTRRSARRALEQSGFVGFKDRWELRQPAEMTGRSGTALKLAKDHPLLRIPGDIVVPGCSFAAKKPGTMPAIAPQIPAESSVA